MIYRWRARKVFEFFSKIFGKNALYGVIGSKRKIKRVWETSQGSAPAGDFPQTTPQGSTPAQQDYIHYDREIPCKILLC